MMYNLKAITLLTIITTMLGQQSLGFSSLRKNDGEILKNDKYQNGRLLVRYKKNTSTMDKEISHFSVGAYVVKSYDVPKNLELVEVVKGISVEDAQRFYREDPNVLYAELDYNQHALLQPPPRNPDDPNPPPTAIDPRYVEQWGLNNDGRNQGVVDADINAPEAWEHITGDRNTIVAIVDTGIDYNHPDLRNNIWVNPGEIPGNHIDDDGNGVIDDVHGFNAIDSTGNPLDDNGHGTHCAGIMGAEGQNTQGGRGVMQEISMIGCKFLDGGGSGSTAGAIDCLNYLRDLKSRSQNPVNIIATSNSWGGGPHSQALEDAIREHGDLGILFIAAASNDAQNNDEVDTYPTDYPLANIISVAATNRNDTRAWFSNYGKRTVHVGAPGEDIVSTYLNNAYQSLSGTSMATPFVTGLVAMIKAYNPELSMSQLRNLVIAGGSPNADLADKTISGRRIRVEDVNGIGSLSCVDQIVNQRLSPMSDHMLITVGESVLFSAININCSEANGAPTITVSPDGGDLVLEDEGEGIGRIPNDGTYSKTWIAEAPGRYEFTFPNGEKVFISVYDPANVRAYTRAEEPFNYRQIEGLALTLSDDSFAVAPSPFTIDFGGIGRLFDQVSVSSNGVVSLTNFTYLSFINEELPFLNFTTLIAPYWDDLNPAQGGTVSYATLGEAPDREFVIEWRDVPHFGMSNDGITFQAVFFENSSDIVFNYLDVDFGAPDVSGGASATIGVQTNHDHFFQVGFEENVITPSTSIRFSLAPPAALP